MTFTRRNRLFRVAARRLRSSLRLSLKTALVLGLSGACGAPDYTRPGNASPPPQLSNAVPEPPARRHARPGPRVVARRAGPPDAATLERGRLAFNRLCGVCHGNNPKSRHKDFYVDRFAHAPVDAFITRMKLPPLTERERADLLAFMRSLKVRQPGRRRPPLPGF